MSSLTFPPEHESEMTRCKHGRAIESVCEFCDDEKIEALEARVEVLEAELEERENAYSLLSLEAGREIGELKARVEVLEGELLAALERECELLAALDQGWEGQSNA